ncbi:MAG: nucleotidyltransferase domain-containing protein [Myxococcota bacterium]
MTDSFSAVSEGLDKNALKDLMGRDPRLGFLPELVSLAKGTINPAKIVLFGSRARGDARERSDVDLAFVLDEKACPSRWGAFATAAREDLRTLLELDLVKFNEVSQAFSETIVSTGIVIYER